MYTKMLLVCAVLALAGQSLSAQPAQKNTYYNKWANAGPLKNATFFPVAVWYQPTSRAAEYAAAGVNLYIGPSVNSSSALTTMKNNGLYTISEYSLSLKNDANASVILGWMHQDEPDNDQNGAGCVDPTVIKTRYSSWVSSDPTRPIYLNLGLGVAYIEAGLRGTCSGEWEMYFDYIEGCDIPSFDIYPCNDAQAAVNQNLWYVAKGIDSLRSWSLFEKPCWCWIECTKIGESATEGTKPTPKQVRSEVWQALIHEAAGYGYFCHSWFNGFYESAWLSDAPMKAEITKINQEVKQLAPALNSPTIADQVTVTVNWRTPVETMLKNQGGAGYLFCGSNRRSAPVNTATIQVNGLPSSVTSAEVIGESRTVTVSNGQFQDDFDEWRVHLYKFSSPVAIQPAPVTMARKLERTIRFKNPARGQLLITKHFDLKGEPLSVGIYNAAGQLVRSVGSSIYLPTIFWDGTDGKGQVVPDGFYYVVVTVGTAGLVKPLVLVR